MNTPRSTASSSQRALCCTKCNARFAARSLLLATPIRRNASINAVPRSPKTTSKRRLLPRLQAAEIEPASLGLGDMVAATLSAVGITKERVARWSGGGCGCQRRQEALNRLGDKIAGFLRAE